MNRYAFPTINGYMIGQNPVILRSSKAGARKLRTSRTKLNLADFDLIISFQVIHITITATVLLRVVGWAYVYLESLDPLTAAPKGKRPVYQESKFS